MKILMLTPRFPFPPNRGDCIRAWGELTHLAARHEVWLASLAEATPSPEALNEVRRRCRNVAVAVRSPHTSLIRGGLSLLRGSSITRGYFSHAELAKTVRAWGRDVKFDAVLAFSSGMAPYSALVPGARRILDMNDVDSFKWRRYSRTGTWPARALYALEARRLAESEREWCQAHDVTVVVNARERRRLDTVCDPHRAAVIRTGVEIGRHPGAARSAPARPVVGLIGSMSYAPNIRAAHWFAESVWPSVIAARPDAEWLIVGRSPSRSVRRLGRMPGVTVTGPVDDLTPLLSRLRVFVAPMRDDLGVQTKLIHALAHGVPAVCTTAAADGMEWNGSPPFLVADNPAEFASAVVRVLDDAELASQLSAAAFRNVAEYYDVRRQVSELESLLRGERDGRESCFRDDAGVDEVVLAASAASRLAG